MGIVEYLPAHPGLLPQWLLFVSVISSLNSAQAYLSPTYTALIYNATSPHPLSSRTFGTWTLLSSMVRAVAAYHITDGPVYVLAMATYALALTHFVAEWLVFESAKAQGRFLSPLVVASGSLAWMVTQWGWYVQ